MVVVVEGKHDASLIYSIFKDAYVIITNGSEINDATIGEIERVSKSQKVYLCLDPDGPGNKIRNKILNKLSKYKWDSVVEIVMKWEQRIL